MPLVSEQEECRLLLGVCPLFENEIQWVPTNLSTVDKAVVEMTAGKFRIAIRLIKVLVPAESSLPDNAYNEFVYSIQALLSSLEALLSDAIKTERNSQFGSEAEVSLLQRYLHKCTCTMLTSKDEWQRII